MTGNLRCFKLYRSHVKIKSNEWDEQSEAIVVPVNDTQRKYQVESVERCIKWDIQRLEKIVEEYEDKGLSYGLNHIADAYQKLCQKHSLFSFIEDVIAQYQRHGQIRTSETYLTTLNSFKRFRMDVDIMLEEINSELLPSYEYYLKVEGVSPNTISFYMHRLRAVYNRAVEQELVEQRFPFKRVKTSIEKIVKRAIPVKFIRKLKSLYLSDSPSKAFARDMFLFSFYTRGMSFIDIAYLQKKDSQYLFSIIEDPQKDNRRQYQNALIRINRNLKKLGEDLGLELPLTMYVARHSWATTARSEGVPISVISEGMGHDNEKTTQIYLASLEHSVVDKANRKILKLV